MDENVVVKTPPISREESIRTGGRGEPKLAPRVPLGEELPLFCERCGYSLHGMPQVRCDHCTVLQFHCPECGHHQPINTLRPAAQRVLGRLRATGLAMGMLFKLCFFGLLLFAWGAMPTEWIYTYQNPRQVITGQLTLSNGTIIVGSNGSSTVTIAGPTYAPRPVDLEAIIAHVLFAIAFGVVARMLLLRWRRGWVVGLVLGGLVFVAYLLGAWFDYWERQRHSTIPPPMNFQTLSLALTSAVTVALGAAVAWAIWCGLAKLFLPNRAADAMLQWQRSMSDPSSLARQ